MSTRITECRFTSEQAHKEAVAAAVPCTVEPAACSLHTGDARPGAKEPQPERQDTDADACCCCDC